MLFIHQMVLFISSLDQLHGSTLTARKPYSDNQIIHRMTDLEGFALHFRGEELDLTLDRNVSIYGKEENNL